MSNTLIIFAHQDDEYGIASRILHETRLGNRIYCAYLTNGWRPKSTPEVRAAESVAALASLGIPRERIFFIGNRHGIFCDQLINHLTSALALLHEYTSAIAIHKVYCHAYEGGHPDHDAAHVITLAYARQSGLLDHTYEFSMYNGHRTVWKFYRTLSPLKTGLRREVRHLTWRDAFQCAFLCTYYKSQWSTWCGLFPEAFIKLLVLRREIIQSVSCSCILRKPHDGKLLYERMHRLSYETFRNKIGPFAVDAQLLPRV